MILHVLYSISPLKHVHIGQRGAICRWASEVISYTLRSSSVYLMFIVFSVYYDDCLR